MEFINKIFESKLIRDSIYFKMIFIFWAFFHSLTFGQYITGYFSIVMIAWGALIVIKNLFIKKIEFNKVYKIISLMFIGAYIITILLNRDLNLVSNVKTLIWITIILLGVFPVDCKIEKDIIITNIKKLSTIIIIPTFLASIISMLMFFASISFWVSRVDGGRIPQGYFAARLWGIYVDPNSACNLAIIAIVFSILAIYLNKTRKKSITIFNAFNIIVQYIFIIMTASRGGALGLIFLIMGLSYIVFDFLFRNKITIKGIRVIVSLLLGAILLSGLVYSFDGTRKAVAKVPKIIKNIENDIVYGDNESELEQEEATDINTVRPDTDSSNGRIELWLDGLKLSKESIIFGHGDRNILQRAKEYLPESRLTLNHVHNGYLHLLLSGGMIAFLLMFVLIGTIAIKSLVKILKVKEYTKEYFIMSILSILAGSILITTVFLSEVFYLNSFTTLVFWSNLGYIVFFGKELSNQYIK